MTRALASAGWDVHSAKFEPVQLDNEVAAGRDLYVLDADAEDAVEDLLRAMEASDSARSKPRLLLSRQQHHRLLEMLCDHGVNNFIGRHSISPNQDVIDESELLATCKKLLGGDCFGLRKYMPTWGMRIHQQVIRSVQDKFAVTAKLERFLEEINCFASLVPSIALVAEELLMNAIFNAPGNPDGGDKYAGRDRADMFDLLDEERVDFVFACDGQYVGLSATDRFGRLGRGQIVHYLQRSLDGEQGQIEEKEGGAGLGLHMIFSSVTQLVFNIEPGKRTEVIALFYIRGGAKAFRRSNRSLNIFIAG